MSDKLTTTYTNTSNKLSIHTKPLNSLAAKLAAAKQTNSLASDNLLDFKQYPNRIVIAVDDSGSMSTSMITTDTCKCGGLLLTEDLQYCNTCKKPLLRSRMYMAKLACESFLQVCNPSDTVLGMYTISTSIDKSLNWNYTDVTNLIKELSATGGTPTFETLDRIIKKENATRVVLISDGHSSNYTDNREQPVLTQYKTKNVIIDTVFIGSKDDTSGIREMQTIAETTGGQFIHFTDAKDFASKFKYLAPAYYGMLTSGELKV